MKKLAIIAAMALAASAASAQSAEDLRIYINPGHGSWTGNDRPQNIIGKPKYSDTNTDTTGFFESNTNLWKCFGMLEKLIEYGIPFDRTLNQTGERWEIGAARDLSQNIVMSRVKNGPYEAVNTKESPNYMQYNRSLPLIAAEVEYNEFDMFISVHSNAAVEGSSTNYHLFMYRGRNGIQNVAVQGSWEMAETVAKHSIANGHAQWSNLKPYINGDIDFMGSGSGSTGALGYYGFLGVLKHGCPGFLVEGYFHTYQPARHRGMNVDVDYEEGISYARGIADYFGLEMEKTGNLYGVVRDANTKFTHSFYKPAPSSNDRFLPLNGCKVKLLKDGQVINEYTTDEFYNGAFVFFNLEPGVYHVQVEHPDYRKSDPVEVTVTPAETAYPTVWMVSKEFAGSDTNTANYPDPVNDKAFGPAGSYEMTAAYTDEPIAQLEGKTVRRVVARKHLLYVLALDADNNPTLIVYNTADKKVEAEVSTEGTEGTYMPLSDIQVTADGYLVGSAMSKVVYEEKYREPGETDNGTLWFYRWDLDASTGLPVGNPKKWISTSNTGLWFRAKAGGTFAYSGSTDDGTIVYSAQTTGETAIVRTVTIGVVEGKNAGEAVHKPSKAESSASDLGDDFRFTTSPVNDKNYFVSGSGNKHALLEYNFNHTDDAEPVSRVAEGVIDPATTGVGYFRYAGTNYMVVPDTKEGSNQGVKLYAINDGIEEPVAVATTNTSAPAAATAGFATGFSSVTLNEANAIQSADIDLLLLRDGKLSRFTTAGIEQPRHRGHYAYGLELTGDYNTGYSVNFKSTGAAPAAKIVLTDTDNGEQTTIDAGAVAEGDNTVAIDLSEMPEKHTYNWSVVIESEPVGTAGVMFAGEKLAKESRGGVQWISDPESPAYGTTVVSHSYARGIDLYSPAMEKSGRYAEGKPFTSNKLNSPFRMGQRDGKIYLCDWSDVSAGYWIFDPVNPEQTPTQFIAGTKDSKGSYTYDGKIIGGGATCITFTGSGDDTMMFSFVEDYPEGNGVMGLHRYDIGKADMLTTAPAKSFDITAKKLMTGTNVEVAAGPAGVFVAQARAAGNNVEESPCFLYMDYDGKILFNSASLDALESCGSGIALSPDGKTLAVSECESGIGVWDVEWTDNVPALTKLYMIPGSQYGKEINQLSFDAAGNLYAFHRDLAGFRAYTLRNSAPKATTPAPKAMVIATSESGVSDITVDSDSNAPVEYFNLQGVRLSGDNLPAGVYIRRQGKTSTKIVVK